MYAHGKLLITGEYFVLDGALALAVPSRFGQYLEVSAHNNTDELLWQSWDDKKQLWFEARWQIIGADLELKTTNDPIVAQRLADIFQAIPEQKAAIFQNLKGKIFTTKLEFPRNWGLGTSSTLISLLAQYWSVNPYHLLSKTFGGSAYDIACATANTPILFQRENQHTSSQEVKWIPAYKDQLFFVYQGKKQNSRDGIKHYKANTRHAAIPIREINALTIGLLHAKTIEEAGKIIRTHEDIVAKTIQLPKIKEQRFSDFSGEVKSLGAWGGDFVMALSPWDRIKTTAYFNTKGCVDVLTFDEMIKTA